MTRRSFFAALAALAIVAALSIVVLESSFPDYGIIYGKEQWGGFRFTGRMSGVVFPRWEVKVTNGLYWKTISVSKAEWERISVGRIYRANFPLRMYFR